MMRYQYDGAPWVCRAPAKLGAEFGIADVQPDLLVELHAALETHARAWKIVCRLFGIGPVVVADEGDVDRVWAIEEVLSFLGGIKRKQLDAEMETARGFWQNHQAEKSPATSVERAKDRDLSPALNGQQSSMQFSEDMLGQFGFSPSMFRVEGRDPADNDREKDWFCETLQNWAHMFSSPVAGPIARNALLNLLRMRRLEALEMQMSSRHKDYSSIRRDYADLESAYEAQAEKLDSLFPWKRDVAGKMSGQATVSALIVAIREYQANRNHELIDGLFTAAELHVEVQTHTLQEDCQYRLGLVTYLQAARKGMWDPHWQNEMDPSVLAKLDKGFQMGVRQAREDLGEALLDIEAEGPEGEYPPVPKGLL